MPVFAYHAVDATSNEIRGTIAAESPREARDQLRAKGLLISGLSQQAVRKRAGWLPGRSSGRQASNVAIAVRDLATLLTTGIGLVDALDTMGAQYQGRFRMALLTLRERVAGGNSLSEAMQSDPEFFDELTVQMVRVGENAGTLDVVLDRLADFRERYLLFKDRITTALVYPAIIIILAVTVSIFLMTVVLPMLLENLVESGRPLPWPTRVLKFLSESATTHGWWILSLFVFVAVSAATFVRLPRGRRLWHRFVFALPLIGPLAKKQEIARAAVIISTLMENGIVFVDATETAARASKNILLKESLDAIRSKVQSGRDIGDALQATGVFPPLVIQIFTVGQQTGELERMLNRLAIGYERQVASATARLTAAIEPILIVVLAIVVGFILFATILPILEAGNVL